MPKYFKNYKSEGDGEYRTVEKPKVHPRSYSCKPDIGPSGDHKSSGGTAGEIKRDFRVNMWLNNIGSVSSESTHGNTELYRISEEHLEKLNSIRRKLRMKELQGTQEREAANEASCNRQGEKMDHIAQEELRKNISAILGCTSNDECNIHGPNDPEISPQNGPLSSLNESSKVSMLSSDSASRYKPPLKKICLHAEEQSAVTILAPVRTTKTNYSETDIIEIPYLNLYNEQASQHNENKSIQCTSRETELTKSSPHSTDHSKSRCHHQRDNIDLAEVDLHVEPEIVLKQPHETSKVSNENCITFLPIRDEELTVTDKYKKNEFFDEIVSNCSFSFGTLPAPLVPSQDSFFKSRKKQKKKRFKKRGRSIVEGVKLDKSSIEVQRIFLNTSDTSEAIQEIGEVVKPAIDASTNMSTFNNTLMTSLAIPPKLVKPLKLPFVTKLSELIHGANCKNSKIVEMDKIEFDDDICSEKSNSGQCNTYTRVDTNKSNYREAAEDLSRGERTTDDMTDDGIIERLRKNLRKQPISNKYNTKRKQSVDYNFYSLDLSHGRTCDMVPSTQEVEEDSDSECLRAVENCCCIKRIFNRIFKRRRGMFLSN